jgi:hypothetical protein
MSPAKTETVAIEVAPANFVDVRSDLPAVKCLTARAGSGDERDHDPTVAYLYDHLRKAPQHRDFAERLERPGSARRRSLPRNVLVGVVPGAFYAERPETGAGGEAVLAMVQSLGVAVERVPLPSLASCQQNAELLHLWCEQRVDRRLIIVSLSKGSLDVLRSLSLPDHALRRRRPLAWISLSGILQGTPLVDWLCQRRLRRIGARTLAWWRGLDWQALSELKYQRDWAQHFADWELSMLRIAHVVGFPRLCDLSSRLARRVVSRTSAFGPNDGGGIVLSDVLNWPGLVYPVWGADHYLQPHARLFPLIQRLLAWALEADE